jgi:hypothetical protein
MRSRVTLGTRLTGIGGSDLSYIRTNSGKHLRGVEYAGIAWTTYINPKHETNERVYIYCIIYIRTPDLELPRKVVKKFFAAKIKNELGGFLT